jgi:trk system potassium uptake protein
MKKTVLSDRQLLLLCFLSLVLFGFILLSLPVSYKNGSPASWIDRIFTAVSAVCVTGLATFPTSDLSRTGQIFLLILIQTGGLGYVTFTTLYLFFPGTRFSFRSSSIIQQYFGENQVLHPRRIMLNILGFTFGIEFLGGLLLYWGMISQGESAPLFSSLFHAVSAFCNAGFSLYPDSLTRFTGNFRVLTGISLLIISGGLGFMVLWNLGKKFRYGKKVRLMYHSRLMLVLTPLFLLAGFFFFFLEEWDGLLAGLPRREALGAALFQSITTRTAGFNTIEQGGLSHPSLIVTLFLMLTGGGSGSTAGGLKVSTIFLLTLTLIKGVDDHGEVSFLKRRISREQLNRAGLYFMKAITLLFLSVLLVSLVEEGGWGGQFSFIDILYECVSALGTVGLSMGITEDLHILSKIVIIFTMFAGRVGLFAVIMPQIYASEAQKYIRYPKGEVLIG